uniref:Uncharacterized protein n=1 Tax=Arundo donax TaxID=35708 RepID=A0A0A9S680_ARUDO
MLFIQMARNFLYITINYFTPFHFNFWRDSQYRTGDKGLALFLVICFLLKSLVFRALFRSCLTLSCLTLGMPNICGRSLVVYHNCGLPNFHISRAHVSV